MMTHLPTIGSFLRSGNFGNPSLGQVKTGMAGANFLFYA
jgi:hypothetical protein